jgi:acylphosphatase
LEKRRARVRVAGFVQGVYFRAETRDRARSLRVGGWVRNAADGTVEAVFEGEGDLVESMIAWCRRGPRGAVVDSVDVEWEEPVGDRAFRVVG